MTLTPLAWVIGAATVGYLCGSVSSAVLVCRLAGLPDPRSEGSRNPGATNVLRIGGKGPALATLIGDFVKGYLPVAIAGLMGAPVMAMAAVVVAAFAGHLYPVFFGFQGGKGVATSLGVVAGLSIWLGLAAGATWLATAVITRISSASSLVTALLVPVYTWILTGHWILVAATTILALLQFWRHRANISNLLSGNEPKIGAGKTPPAST